MEKNLVRNIIARKIEVRTLRMGLNAQYLISHDAVGVPPPDYGLGVIPKLSAIAAANEKAMEAIEECSISVSKLVLISDFDEIVPAGELMLLLKNNRFDSIPLLELGELLEGMASKAAAIPCWSSMPQRG